MMGHEGNVMGVNAGDHISRAMTGSAGDEGTGYDWGVGRG